MFGNRVFAMIAVAGMIAIPAADAAEMTVKVGGRIQVDGALYDDDVTDLGSGTEIRRARLFVEGDIAENWYYKAQYDFASDAEIKDLFVSYTSDIGQFTIGQSKVPFGLEALTSSKYLTFMERSLPITAFAPFRRIGVNYGLQTDAWYLQAMVFGKNANDDNLVGDEGLGIAGRATWTPVKSDGRLIHVGIDGMWKEPNSTTTKLAVYRTRPESHVTDMRLVRVTLTDINSTTLTDIELAGVWGGFSVQGEYLMTSVDTDQVGVSNPDFDGYYVSASWFPGGETRPYKYGSFQRVKANNAWEFAARYSSVDLDDNTFTGGKEENTTLGVNYYVNPYLRFMANYIFVDVTGGPDGSQDPNIFQVRAAMDFK